jgi:hypothetical protein
VPAGWVEVDSTHLDRPGPLNPPDDPYADAPTGTGSPSPPDVQVVRFLHEARGADRDRTVIRLPDYAAVREARAAAR